MYTKSFLEKVRLHYKPELPPALKNLSELSIEETAHHDVVFPEIAALFPSTVKYPYLNVVKEIKKHHQSLRIGVVFSGGQAPGGHNVIAGIFDALKTMNPSSVLFGFLDGPSGCIQNKYIEITEKLLSNYRNQGGFDLIGSGRTKIETIEQFQAAEKTARSLDLDGFIIIGGDDSNTNAALLAEKFVENGCKTAVIGVPKTIDGDLKGKGLEISFGFDTACKTYSETIGNLMRDALSAKKYYYFIKLMGRSASHITLECALQTHPNLAFISEEIAEEQHNLTSLVSIISDAICSRAAQGKNYGVILIPEGLIEFIPEVNQLIMELNILLANDTSHNKIIEAMANKSDRIAYVAGLLSDDSMKCFQKLPEDIQAQLLIGRDSHGNVQVSKIETERMLIEMVKNELNNRAKAGTYSGHFNAQPHFCGYEGRACMPSNFDSQYCYALGYFAAFLVDAKVTGYICSIKNLAQPVENWQVCAIPLTAMMTMEKRFGKLQPVVQKALVDLKGRPYQKYKQCSSSWILTDDYVCPGPIQYFGPDEINNAITKTLFLESLADLLIKL